MSKTTVRWCAVAAVAVLAVPLRAGLSDPPVNPPAAVSAPAGPPWTVTETVPDRRRPGRVKCEIVGWTPLDIAQMEAVRERVEAKQMLAWYHERTPEADREPEVESLLREYGLAAGGAISFDSIMPDVDMRAISERAEPFLASVGWCLLTAEAKADMGLDVWVTELIRRIEAIGNDGPPLRMVGLWLTAVNTLERLNDDRAAFAKEQAELQLARACALPGLDYDDREYLWRKYASDRSNSKDPAVIDAWLDRLKAQPGVDPWVLNHSLGVALVDKAWELRGDAVASRTNEAQFRGFSRTLIQARAALMKAWEHDPRLARTATEMIAVTMGGEGARGLRELDWFARATAAQFDYFGAYNRLVVALRPRWGGSYEKIADFAESCNREEFYSTWVAVQGTYAFNTILTDSAETDDWRWLYERPAHARAYMELLDGVREHYEGFSQTLRNSYATRAVILAVQLGDLEDAEKRLRALGDGYNEPTPRYMRLYGYRPHGEVFPFTGPGREIATQAATAERDGLHGEAADLWRQTLDTVLAKTPDDAMGIAAVRDRLRVSELTHLYDRGGWVGVPLDADRSGLRGYYDYDIKTSDAGYSTVTSHEPDQLFHLYPPIELGTKYEIEVSMRPAGEGPEGFEFGVLFNAGLSSWTNAPFAHYEFSVLPAQALTGIGREFKWQPGWSAVQPDDNGWYHFGLVYDDGVITAVVNGVDLGRVVRSDFGGPNPFAVNAGISLNKHQGHPVDVRGLRFRKLPDPGDG